MSGPRLEIFCFEERAGELVDEADGLSFAYDETWLSRDRPPLSLSLPLDGAFARGAPAAYFGGLLPEGEPRELLARRLGISAENDFELLRALGGDTAGAISLLEPGRSPVAGGDVEWLEEAQLGSSSRNCRAARCTPTRTASTACRWRALRISCRCCSARTVAWG